MVKVASKRFYLLTLRQKGKGVIGKIAIKKEMELGSYETAGRSGNPLSSK
jgi:hypothetical protein